MIFSTKHYLKAIKNHANKRKFEMILNLDTWNGYLYTDQVFSESYLIKFRKKMISLIK